MDNVNNQILTWLITISGQLDQINHKLSEMQGDTSVITGAFRNKINSAVGDTFGERLKYVMKLRNMHGKDLAERVNIDVSTISRYVNNKSYPKPWIIKNIADVLMVDVSVLLADSNEEIFNE